MQVRDTSADDLEVVRRLCAVDFPWDTLQALSFALFRTYAVPRIGELLAQTGELVDRTQKRYEDTGLLLDAVLEHGPDSAVGRDAVRRINAMHRAHDLRDDDLRYVLSTFVVLPVRWVEAYGWRAFTPAERTAATRYYRDLGRRMGIPDLPETWDGFSALLDEHERASFGFSAGGRRVADATLQLLTTFPLHRRLPARVVRTAALALMDDPLLDALDYPRPPAAVRWAVRTGLRLRGRVVRHLPARRRPRWFRQQPVVRLYPDGFDVRELGTFPATCPVPRRPDPA